VVGPLVTRGWPKLLARRDLPKTAGTITPFDQRVVRAVSSRLSSCPSPLLSLYRCCGPRRRRHHVGRPAELLGAAVRDTRRWSASTAKTMLVKCDPRRSCQDRRRIVLIEDTRELQRAAPNLVAPRNKQGAALFSDLVLSSLHLRADRIPAVEVHGPKRWTFSRPRTSVWRWDAACLPLLGALHHPGSSSRKLSSRLRRRSAGRRLTSCGPCRPRRRTGSPSSRR
jgi:hypothetical protein